MGTLPGRTSSDTVTFCGGSRASVVLNNTVVLCLVDLSKIVRAQRGTVASNVYVMEGANAKGKRSATESTAASHTSNSAVAFCGGAGKLKLEPCVPSMPFFETMMMSKTPLQAQVHMRTPAEITTALSALTKATTRQCASVLLCTLSRQKNDAQKVSCNPQSLVWSFVIAKRACKQIRRCCHFRLFHLSGRHCPALVLIQQNQAPTFV